jgi:tetratricopeptide (TPR) repeat protein
MFSHISDRLSQRFQQQPTLWSVILLLTLVWLLFARSLGGDFVMDDWPVIKDNSRITQASAIPDYFRHGVWANTDLAEQVGLQGTVLYRPLFLLTLNAAHHLWGDNPLGYHLLNVGLHSINVLLVFLLLRGLLPTQRAAAALLGAALFAVHPVHVESIAWSAGLTDPLVSLFLLGAMLAYRRYSDSGRNSSALLAVLGYGAALLSKEVAVFFPLLLLAHDSLFRGRLYPRRYLPYGLLFILYFIARSHALGASANWSSFDLGQWPLLVEFTSHYLQLLILPWPLEYYYAKPNPGLPALLFGGGLLLAMLWWLLRAIRMRQQAGNQPLITWALLWLSITLLPALPIALMAEPKFAIRVLYLPSVGLSLLLAQALVSGTAQRQRALAGASIAVLLGFTVISWQEIPDWHNDRVFYQQAALTSPNSFRPLAGLAESYEREGNMAQAATLNLQAAALATKPGDQLDFLEKAAQIYGQRGEVQNSERYYQQIVQRDPQRSSAWVGLGNNALARGQLTQARDYYLRAYQANTNNPVASYNLALVYQRLGDRQQARRFQLITQRLQQVGIHNKKRTED